MTRSIFENLELAPRDPILGMTEAYNADPRPTKVNLGVGVYTDENGKLPLLKAVAKAEELRLAQHPARGYLPIEGIAGYNQAAQNLLFGTDSPVIKEGRAVTFQALGGTGALKIGADFLRKLEPQAQVWISDPSWENHRALFENAGFTVNTYPYYDASTRGLNFAAMAAALDKLPARSIIVLHSCCHNPTGADLDTAQWQKVVEICRARDLIPFLDTAYQGFGDGIDADAAAIRLFGATELDFFVSSSYSKSFSLYGERVGALTIVTGNRDESARVLSQVKRVIHQLLQSANPRRLDRGHRAQHARAAPALGRRTGRHAQPHPRDAPGPGRQARRQGRQARLQLRVEAARHVLVLGPDQRAGRPPAQRAWHLCHRHGPHLRRRAERTQPRRGGQRHRGGAVSGFTAGCWRVEALQAQERTCDFRAPPSFFPISI